MALTLADYLRQHPSELDEKSIALSETTAFTTYFERVCMTLHTCNVSSYCSTEPGIGKGHGSRWSLPIGNFWRWHKDGLFNPGIERMWLLCIYYSTHTYIYIYY